MNNMGHSLGFCLGNCMCKPALDLLSDLGPRYSLRSARPVTDTRRQSPLVHVCDMHTTPLTKQTCYLMASAARARACGVNTLIPPQAPNHWLIAVYCASLPQAHSGCSHGSVWARLGPSYSAQHYTLPINHHPNLFVTSHFTITLYPHHPSPLNVCDFAELPFNIKNK